MAVWPFLMTLGSISATKLLDYSADFKLIFHSDEFFCCIYYRRIVNSYWLLVIG